MRDGCWAVMAGMNIFGNTQCMQYFFSENRHHGRSSAGGCRLKLSRILSGDMFPCLSACYFSSSSSSSAPASSSSVLKVGHRGTVGLWDDFIPQICRRTKARWTVVITSVPSLDTHPSPAKPFHCLQTLQLRAFHWIKWKEALNKVVLCVYVTV